MKAQKTQNPLKTLSKIIYTFLKKKKKTYHLKITDETDTTDEAVEKKGEKRKERREPDK